MAEVAKPNTRLRWEELPPEVRSWVADLLGEPIAEAVSQSGGFSPGTADRLVGSGGGRLFVKSVSRDVNRMSYELFRIEAAVFEAHSAFPLPVPALRGVAEHDSWLTLAFDDIEGREAGGEDADIAAVFATLAILPDDADRLALPPAPGTASRSAAGVAARWAARWKDLLADNADLLPLWAHQQRRRLAELAAYAPQAVGGSRLAHLDLRSDNTVIDSSGKVWLVDWPWAGTAAPWFDAMTYLIGLATTRPLLQLDAWTTRPGTALAEAAPDDIDAVLAAQAGALLQQSVQSRPNRLPGLAELQRRFALRLFDWLELRTRW